MAQSSGATGTIIRIALQFLRAVRRRNQAASFATGPEGTPPKPPPPRGPGGEEPPEDPGAGTREPPQPLPPEDDPPREPPEERDPPPNTQSWLGALGSQFSPGVVDPLGQFTPANVRIAQYLADHGMMITSAPPSLSQFDSIVRLSPTDPGVFAQFISMAAGDSPTSGLGRLSDVLHIVDGRGAGLTEADVRGSLAGVDQMTVPARMSFILANDQLLNLFK